MTAPKLWTAFTISDGREWSWSRLTCTVLLVASIVWGSYIVWFEKKIPDFTSVALLIGAIYGVNRVAEWKESQPPQPQQPPQPVQPTQNIDIRA